MTKERFKLKSPEETCKSGGVFRQVAITDDHPTPRWLFDDLDREFNFTIDVAAAEHNTKCVKYFDKKKNGLLQSWQNHVVWCNPPYDQKNLKEWVMKAWKESKKQCTVVLLLPAKTDQTWFHQYGLKAEVRFICGRVTFEGNISSAPFPSMLLIFKDHHSHRASVTSYKKREKQENLFGGSK